MGACSWIRESGYFNKAINYYADKYNVNADDIAKYVRIAQGNGQRNANKTKRKYYWFAVEYSLGNERNGADYFEKNYAEYDIRKGLSSETVMCTMSEKDDIYSEYSPQHYFGRVEGFEQKEEAIKAIRRWKNENKRPDWCSLEPIESEVE